MNNVFISSTSKDLAEYRKAAIDACLELKLFPVAMEYFEAIDAGATAASLKKLDECDLYIGIFAFRYGYIEAGYDKSVTELEYDGAEERKLERVCFVLDPKHPFPTEFIDSDRTKIEAFRAKVQTKVVKFFGSVEDFKAKLIPTLVAWKDKHPSTPARGTTTVTSGKGLVHHVDDVPRRARTFIGRAQLQADIHTHLNEGKTVLLQGFGGMGKTALSAEVAAERIKPNEAILWLEVGDSPSDALLQALARPFGREREVASAGDDAASVVKAILRESDVRLVVLDNAWNGAALYKAVEALPRNLPLLASARQRFALDEILPVDQLPPDEALKLLELYAGKLGDDADKLCKELGYLPFALEIAGKTLKTHGWTPRELLTKLGNTLHEMKVPLGFHEDGRENVAALLQTSLKALDDESRTVFMAFGALFAPSATPEMLTLYLDANRVRSLEELFTVLTYLEGSPTILETTFVEAALLQLQSHGLAERILPDEENIEVYRIHELAFDYANALTDHHQHEQALAACLSYTERHKKPSSENFRVLRPEVDNLVGAMLYAFDRKLWNESERFLYISLYEGPQSQGGFLIIGGFYSEALKLLTQAILAAQERGRRYEEGAHFGNLGRIHCNLGQYDIANRYLIEELKIAIELGSKSMEGNALGWIGNTSLNLGQFDKAIVHYTEALAIARDLGDRGNEGIWLGNLGNIYFSLGKDYDTAIEVYEQALEIAREVDDKRHEGIWLGNLGNCYNNLEKYDEAIEFHMEALAIRRIVGDRLLEGNSLNNLAIAYENKGNFANAMDCFQQARTIYVALDLEYRIEMVDENIEGLQAKMSGG
jgi:tetratricopeptide (TPR) repeat protein